MNNKQSIYPDPDLSDWSVRYTIACECKNPSESQIAQGLLDPHEYVAAVWVNRADSCPTEKQITDGLSSSEAGIREAWAIRIDWTPTPEQVEAGITDEDTYVRLAWMWREDWTPNELQAMRGVCTEEDPEIRCMWAKSNIPENVLHDAFNIGIVDEDRGVRLAWAERVDVKASNSQCINGVKDEDDEVRSAWITRKEYNPSINDVECGLRSESECELDAWKTKICDIQAESLEVDEDLPQITL